MRRGGVGKRPHAANMGQGDAEGVTSSSADTFAAQKLKILDRSEELNGHEITPRKRLPELGAAGFDALHEAAAEDRQQCGQGEGSKRPRAMIETLNDAAADANDDRAIAPYSITMGIGGRAVLAKAPMRKTSSSQLSGPPPGKSKAHPPAVHVSMTSPTASSPGAASATGPTASAQGRPPSLSIAQEARRGTAAAASKPLSSRQAILCRGCTMVANQTYLADQLQTLQAKQLSRSPSFVGEDYVFDSKLREVQHGVQYMAKRVYHSEYSRIAEHNEFDNPSARTCSRTHSITLTATDGTAFPLRWCAYQNAKKCKRKGCNEKLLGSCQCFVRAERIPEGMKTCAAHSARCPPFYCAPCEEEEAKSGGSAGAALCGGAEDLMSCMAHAQGAAASRARVASAATDAGGMPAVLDDAAPMLCANSSYAPGATPRIDSGAHALPLELDAAPTGADSRSDAAAATLLRLAFG